MFSNEKIHEIIKATLVADSYSLGAHWVYDEAQLASLPIDWEALNAPQSLWHKGKERGAFTHIGDQAYFGYRFLADKEVFDKEAFFDAWVSEMRAYQGYIDGATRETLANVDEGRREGSHSHDFSVIGRIAPLLLVSPDEESFVANSKTFVALTHDNGLVIESTAFFAKLVSRVRDEDIVEQINKLKSHVSPRIKKMIETGLASAQEESFDAIRGFGPACDVEEGFSGIIHLLAKYTNLKEMLQANAKAGGDSTSRAMIASMVFVASASAKSLPREWYDLKVAL